MSASTLSALRRFVNPAKAQNPGEVCEMCAVAISREHSHVVNVESRSPDVLMPRMLSALHPRGRNAR